ncbi:arginyltransferase [Sporobolomyces salmoneus]|uniref:arginyltransferase n=1 Tax=Sporobolomyces salmoneus TaxID=183962 RepID=UPI003172CF65
MSLSQLYSEVGSSTSTSAESVVSDSAESTSSNETLSILQPFGYSASTCGYCAEVKGQRSRAKSSKSYGCWAHALSCSTYKMLLNRGWRRSGCYMYKPDNAGTCCVQYTISQDSSKFKPTRSQRQVLQRFSAFVKEGGRVGEKGWGPPDSANQSSTEKDDDVMSTKTTTTKSAKGKGKAQNQNPVEFEQLVKGADWVNSTTEQPFKHKFEYILEPASFTDEKYALFKRYQMEVHGEAESKVSVKGSKRFLVDTPLDLEPTSLPGISYGSHHALYRLNGTLIAFAVLDLLPQAVSSVYFVWNPDWSGMSLGKLSALREIEMVREFERKGLWEVGKGRYMMGYYIEVPKMRYKADYQPSFLLDPATNNYYPWEHCKPLIDVSNPKVASFSNPSVNHPPSSTSNTPPASSAPPVEDQNMEDEDDDEDEEEDMQFPSPPPPGCLDPTKLPKSLLLNSYILESRTLVPLLISTAWHDEEMQKEVKELLAATGEGGAGRLAIYMGR